MSNLANHATWLAFRVASRQVALPLDAVSEALPMGWVEPTLGAPAFVAGLTCRAGHLVAVVDMARRLRLPPRRADPDQVLLLLAPRPGQQPLALWVDAVEGLWSLSAGEVLPALNLDRPAVPIGTDQGASDPEALVGEAADSSDTPELLDPQVILGQARFGGQWCHLLDLEKLLAPGAIAAHGDGWQEDFGALEPQVRARLKARSEQIAGQPVDNKELSSWVAFRSASEQFAFPLMHLIEALACPRLFPVADPLPAARHLANYRGAPLLVAEFRRVLGAEPLSDPCRGALLVVKDGAERLGLLVDEVLEVLQVDEQQGGNRGALPWIRGILRVDGRSIGLIDMAALLADASLGTAG